MAFITDGAIFTVSFGAVVALMIGVLFLLLGVVINKRVAVLRRFSIPPPVTGGLIFCIIHLILYQAKIVEFQFDASLQGFFMQLFFTAIGFAASFGVIKKAFKLIAVFLLTTIVLTIGQDLIAVGISEAMGISPLVGLMAGSPSLVGGHGNAAAFGMIAEEWGHSGAVTFGVTASTFGLIAGVLLGNPTAEWLIKRYKLPTAPVALEGIETVDETKTAEFSPNALQNAFMLIVVALGTGYLVQLAWAQLFPNITIVSHVWGLAMGAIFRIVCDAREIKLPEAEIDTLGNTFLALFVSLAICGMKLWELAGLALPLVAILLANTIFTLLFVVFITFRFCGRNYDGACIATGQFGFGMGSVITSMANFGELFQKYAVSKIAYFVVPIVGALLSNFTNAIIVNIFMSILR